MYLFYISNTKPYFYHQKLWNPKALVKKKTKQKEYNIQGLSCEFTTFITHLCCVKNGSNLTPIEQGNVHDSYIITDVIKYAKALLMHQLTPINQSSERISQHKKQAQNSWLKVWISGWAFKIKQSFDRKLIANHLKFFPQMI